MEFLVLASLCGLATAIIGRAKGSSFLIWFAVGFFLPIFGLLAAIFYRSEHEEPDRTCPRCNKELKRYVQVCTRCGLDL